MFETIALSASRPLRVGVLGAAKITPTALIRPARSVPQVSIQAVAARNRERAARFAARHGLPAIHSSYEDLIHDPEIDAIYNPLPNSLHADWTIRALEAGKHVLCEKPLASNAAEARSMDEAAERSNRLLMEAFHWRYHPLTARVLETLHGGELGEVEHIEAAFCVPLLSPRNIRYRLDLSGGAAMDLGSYTVNMIRTFGGTEPTVRAARAKEANPGVDRWLQADFDLERGATARMTVSFFSKDMLRVSCRIRCQNGFISIFNPVLPQLYHRLTLQTPSGRSVEKVPGPSSYEAQLQAFAEAIQSGHPPITDGTAGIKNMKILDAVYRKAGLTPRGQEQA